MKHVAKKILVSALALGLSGGVYAQTGGGGGAGGGGGVPEAVQQAEARPVVQAWAVAGRAALMLAGPTERE